MSARTWLQRGSIVVALSCAVSARADDGYPPALLQHFMKSHTIGDADEARRSVQVHSRPDVDLDGKPDYLVQLRHTDNLCIYEVFRSSSAFAYSGQVACCKWSEQRAKDHLDFICQDPPDMDTDKGKVEWRPTPWSYGDALATPNPALTSGLAARGVAALKVGRFAEAQKLLGEALINGPATAELNFEFAQASKGKGDMFGARMALMDALKLDPQYEPALLARADWYWDEGKKDSAVRAYKKYLEVAKDPVGIERARKRAP
jgi:tetratricopeptide (TPR) repeat protein